MARLRDLKVGMTVKIKKGRTHASRISVDSEKILLFVGKTTTITDINHDELEQLKIKTGLYTDYLWFPPDWIEIVEEPTRSIIIPLQVGMTVKIKKGSNPVFYGEKRGANKYIGRTTKLLNWDWDSDLRKIYKTDKNTDSIWLPHDWFEPVVETITPPQTIPETEKENKMSKKQYILEYKDEVSEIFDDIDSLPKVADDFFDLSINELNEALENGELRLLEVKVVPVKINVTVEVK